MGLLLVGLGAWWPVVSGQYQFFIRDLTFYAWPMKAYLKARLQAGEFPWWTSHVSAGMPYFAEISNQVLYPANVLLWLCPSVPQALSWFVLLHLLGGMLAMGLLARVWGLSRGVAAWAGLIYGYSGYTLSITDNVNYLPAIVYVPLGLAAWRPLLLNGSAPWGVVAAISLVLMVWAGDTLNPVLLGVACAADLLWTGLVAPRTADETRFPWRQGVLRLGRMGGLGVLVSAVQWLPTWELLKRSVRQGPLRFDESTLWSFPPERLIEWVQPFFYGSKYPHPHFIGQFMYPEFREPWADSLYLGLIPVGLAVYALCRQGRRWGIFGLLALAGLLLSFGHFADYTEGLYRAIPWLQCHRYPEKYLFWTQVSLCILAAAGLERLSTRPLKRPAWLAETPWPVLCIAAGGGLFLGLLLLVDLPAHLWIWPHALERSMEWGRHFIDRGAHVDGLRLHTLTVIGAAIGAGLICRGRAKALALMLGLVVLLDLGAVHGGHTPTQPSALATLPPSNALFARILADSPEPSPRIYYDDFDQPDESYTHPATLARVASAFGLTRLEEAYTHFWPYRVQYNQQRLLFNFGILYDLRYQNGRFAPLQPQSHYEMDQLLGRTNPERLMTLSGVRYVASPVSPHNPAWDTPDWTERFRDEGVNIRLLAHRRPLPRAYFVRQVLFNTDPLVYRLVTPAFQDAHTQAEIAAPAHPLDVDAQVRPAKVRIRHDRPEDRRFEVITPDGEGYLVLTEGFFPGWQATVDGRPTAVVEANHRFMAVRVPRGRHTVRLTYTSTLFGLGLGLSLLGLAGAAFWLLRAGRSKPVDGAPADPPARADDSANGSPPEGC